VLAIYGSICADVPQAQYIKCPGSINLGRLRRLEEWLRTKSCLYMSKFI
jgi:hypothetical protein